MKLVLVKNIIMKKLILLFPLLFAAFSLYAQVDLKKGLLLYLPLDMTANDTSGNNYDFTVKRAGSWTANRFSDNNSAFLSHKDSSWLVRDSFQTPAEFTISAWVKPFSDNQRALILGLGNSASNGFGITISNGTGSSGNKLLVTASGIEYDMTKSTETLTKNVWQHIIVSRKSGKFYLYKDAKLNSSGNDITDPDNGVLNIANSIEQIGAGGKAFDGAIDDVKIYNRALSDSEIVALNEEKPVTTNISESVQSQHSIEIYPNPVTANYFTVQLNKNNKTEILQSVEIVNLAGQVVSSQQINMYINNYNINLPQAIKPGIYFVRIKTNETELIEKLIIQ